VLLVEVGAGGRPVPGLHPNGGRTVMKHFIVAGGCLLLLAPTGAAGQDQKLIV
jgi:hypothetical protein